MPVLSVTSGWRPTVTRTRCRFTLSVAGQQILIDPGTHCYHTEEAWRSYFRGTSAHNTVRIDGLDQSVAGGNFLWLHHAAIRCLLFEEQEHVQRVIAEHDGYLRLADPVRHRREIVYDGLASQITVSDTLSCRDTHRVEFFWHFDERCALALEKGLLHVTHERGRLTLQWPAELSAQIVRGCLSPPLGWRSHRFGEKVPCSTLLVAGESTGTWQGTTLIRVYAEP